MPGPRRNAKKRFGQHFLEPAWVVKVLRAVAPSSEDVFLEVGPGRGALTRPLAEAAASVVAFEIDRDLAADLRTDPPPRFSLVEGDFLDATVEQVRTALHGATRVRVAGNLPYNVASPILFKLTELHDAGIPLVDATLMLQREVAARLVAKPGSREYGVLSILIQRHAHVERALTLPPGAFRPPPKVHSALVRLRFEAMEPRPVSDQIFTRLTQAIFTRRRKTLANALLAFDGSIHLAPAEALRLAAIDGVRRPETLSIAELTHLSDVFSRAVL